MTARTRINTFKHVHTPQTHTYTHTRTHLGRRVARGETVQLDACVRPTGGCGAHPAQPERVQVLERLGGEVSQWQKRAVAMLSTGQIPEGCRGWRASLRGRYWCLGAEATLAPTLDATAAPPHSATPSACLQGRR